MKYPHILVSFFLLHQINQFIKRNLSKLANLQKKIFLILKCFSEQWTTNFLGSNLKTL